MLFASNGGRFATQLPCFAKSSSGRRTPCSASCCTATPVVHISPVGGSPPAIRFSAAACSAWGPIEGSSTQVPPPFSYSLAKTATARDSPPLVHQCITSAFWANACGEQRGEESDRPEIAAASTRFLDIGASRVHDVTVYRRASPG